MQKPPQLRFRNLVIWLSKGLAQIASLSKAKCPWGCAAMRQIALHWILALPSWILFQDRRCAGLRWWQARRWSQ